MPVTLSACPACNADIARCEMLFDCVSFNWMTPILRCVCGITFKQIMPNAAELQTHYQTQYYTHETAAFDAHDPSARAERASAGVRLKQIASFLRQDARSLRGLDYGCGSGAFVTHARYFAFAMDGLDPFLPPQPLLPDLMRADLDSLASEQYDFITLLNVAEHLDQPQRTFQLLRRALKPGGALFLSCPWGDSFAARRFGPCWGHLALDEHLLFWTPASLNQMCKRLGFSGPSRYWIGGSPFPLGKVPLKTLAAPVHQPTEVTQIAAKGDDRPTVKQHIQRSIGQFGRAVQAQPWASTLARKIMHHGRLGDYLAYVIRA